jgi:hypothetical protein
VQNHYLQAISVNLEKSLKTEEIPEVIEIFIIKAFCESFYIIENAQFLKQNEVNLEFEINKMMCLASRSVGSWQ